MGAPEPNRLDERQPEARLVVDALTPAQLRQLGEISARITSRIRAECPER